MKENYVNVCFVIDQSGSMHGTEADVIGGFKKVIEEQRAVKDGKCTVSLFKFEDEVEECFLGKDVSEIGELEYEPGGCTALNDAICVAVDRVGEWLASMPEDERPSKNLVVVMTDGHENASRKFSYADARNRIKHQEEKYGWTFIYLGADFTDKEDADRIGFRCASAVSKSKLSKSLHGLGMLCACFRESKFDEEDFENEVFNFAANLEDEYKKENGEGMN